MAMLFRSLRKYIYIIQANFQLSFFHDSNNLVANNTSGSSSTNFFNENFIEQFNIFNSILCNFLIIFQYLYIILNSLFFCNLILFWHVVINILHNLFVGLDLVVNVLIYLFLIFIFHFYTWQKVSHIIYSFKRFGGFKGVRKLRFTCLSKCFRLCHIITLKHLGYFELSIECS